MKSPLLPLLLTVLALSILVATLGCKPTGQANPRQLPRSISLPLILTPLPAFPQAEGFGANAVGGRGGKVIEVTRLDDDGAGTLRAAINAEGPRIVVFRIGGTIELRKSLKITNPYITIAGQSAPGGGITLKNLPSNQDSALIILTHDVVVRYIRSRPGPTSIPVNNGDALEILTKDAYNVIIDHCSLSWAVDEDVSTWYDAHDVTIAWSIIAEGLQCSTHVKGCHSMGMLIGSDGSGNISIHNNLLAQNHERNPMIKTSGRVDVVNNTIYNSWGTASVVTDEYGKVQVNYVGNYVKPGSNTEPDKRLVAVSSSSGLGAEIFVRGNIAPQRPSDDLDELLVVKPDSWKWVVPTRFDMPHITTISALAAYNQVLTAAGANMGIDSQGNTYWRRDAVDERIVDDVRKGIGGIINDPSDVGGWPELAAGVAPEDSDHDGMPDVWEELYGLNPDDPADGSANLDSDGYTNVEEYLNVTDPTH